MPWEILAQPEDYPAVLAALDSRLTGGDGQGDVPDSLLDLPIYAPAAIQDVLDRYPTAASELDVTKQQRITRAAIYFCAARLAPAVVRLTSLTVTTRDLAYSREVFDPEKRAAELRQMAEEELSEVLDPEEVTPNRPTMFTVARGYRGR
jgi:hypothetical protein